MAMTSLGPRPKPTLVQIAFSIAHVIREAIHMPDEVWGRDYRPRLAGWSYVWQSRVEIKGYSVAYFDRIAAFEASYR